MTDNSNELIGCGDRIAGALFDFVGYLTTLPIPLTVGAPCVNDPIIEALKTWAASRGLSLGDARVQDWQQETFIHAIITSSDMPKDDLRYWVNLWLEGTIEEVE